MSFKIGDRVVCVMPWAQLERGVVYTIAGNLPDGCVQVEELLEALPNHNYAESRFVPTANTLATAAAGPRKDDTGKPDITLLDDMPRALRAVVEVMQWAVTDKKPTPYGRGSWQGVSADRYRAAILRHNLDATAQSRPARQVEVRLAPRFQRDEETKLLHLAHQATSALMALEITLRELETQV